MKWRKPILLTAVWLSASWPCIHVDAYDIHAHDHAAGIELCAASDHSCACHACEEMPCSDRTVEIVQRLTAGNPLALHPSKNLLFILSDLRPAGLPVVPDCTGPLRALQTVRLLI